MSDDAILVVDIESYIQRRRAYLTLRRDAAETQIDKGKVVGMLQAIADFEGMIRQLRVIPASPVTKLPEIPNVNCPFDNLVAQWLAALHLPNANIDDFQDDRQQNRVIARHPEQKEGLLMIGKLVRNRALIDAVLGNRPIPALPTPSKRSAIPSHVVAGNGGTCPFCGKVYKYAKAFDTHVARCPKK